MSKNIPPFSFHHEYTQEAAKSELPAEGMKLIHSGKVLKDDDIIDSCYGFFGTDFANNGMLDYIDHNLLGVSEEEVIALLEEAEFEY